MKQRSVQSLHKEIEVLRSKLHEAVSVRQKEQNELVVNDQILKISKQLDELIVQYMRTR